MDDLTAVTFQSRGCLLKKLTPFETIPNIVTPTNKLYGHVNISAEIEARG